MMTSRLLRFRLRTLLALVAVVSMGLAWYSYNARQYAADLNAFQRIDLRTENYGVRLCWEPDDTIIACGKYIGGHAALRWHGPEWLRKPLVQCGLPILYRLDFIALHRSEYDDGVIAKLAEFRHLEWIYLKDTAVSDLGMRRLRATFPAAKIEFYPPSFIRGSPAEIGRELRLPESRL